MACVNPDGSLTSSARQMLAVLAEPCSPEEAAAKAGQPLFRVRSSFREMIEAGLIEEIEGKFRATEAGQTAAKK